MGTCNLTAKIPNVISQHSWQKEKVLYHYAPGTNTPGFHNRLFSANSAALTAELSGKIEAFLRTAHRYGLAANTL